MKIAQITNPKPSTLEYKIFIADLINAGFKGETSTTYAERTVFATDNSIYQQLPQAIIYPQDQADVIRLTQVLAQHKNICITARGGGTGTNGQSLTTGVVVDLSRHMNHILEINTQKKWARVQAGVIKDQLNLALKPYGLFFAPELSTSNRATIGGMINTDACGQGSCTYGKTRNHVLELDVVLASGETHTSCAINANKLQQICAQNSHIGRIYQTAHNIASTQADLIKAKFPKLNRCLTGYDLAHLFTDDNFNLNSLLCGSEGSLGIITSAKLNVLPIPKYRVLVNIRYPSFMDALHDATNLMQHKPLSIETVDSKVLNLAMQDFIWHSVEQYFPSSAIQTLGINLVEFSGDDEFALNAIVADFVQYLKQNQSIKRLGHTLASGASAINKIYAMRKRAVGLLGNVQGEARPQPFVEDTAVPPQNLATYIQEFRDLLDSYNLQYGMFGHVDAGVLHVRPALDMKNPQHEHLIRPISDAVADLTAKYGGLLWGEHGKGVRSEYAPKFFGELYPLMQQIKAIFDPYNQLNPGKIATLPTPPQQTQKFSSSKNELIKIDQFPTRGALDRQIAPKIWQQFGAAMHCNGNGACYNFDPSDAMCPTYKATRKREQSPKGRASLLREWLRLQNLAGVDISQIKPNEHFLTWLFRQNPHNHKDDFAHEVYAALVSCTACKACSSTCPIKVNVPEFRAQFLQLYHGRYKRPLRDYFIAYLEFILPLLAKFPRAYNLLSSNKISQKLTAKTLGLIDSPKIHPLFKLEHSNYQLADIQVLANLSKTSRAKSVVIMPDVFTRYFDSEVLINLIDFINKLGFTPYLMPIITNGKALQVLGFLHDFSKVASKTANVLADISALGITLIGLDPAMTLVYRDEYVKIANVSNTPKVLLPQEWLAGLHNTIKVKTTNNYVLLPHCTEKTNLPNSNKQWIEVFNKFGLNLEIANVGCCGMAGTFGHIAGNLDTSKQIYQLSWAKYFADITNNDNNKTSKANDIQTTAQINTPTNVQYLTTGYSCRSQVKRFAHVNLKHPIQILNSLI